MGAFTTALTTKVETKNKFELFIDTLPKSEQTDIAEAALSIGEARLSTAVNQAFGTAFEPYNARRFVKNARKNAEV